MNKVKLEFQLPKTKTIEYNGIEIEILPFIGAGEQISLINKYITDYFVKTDRDLVSFSQTNFIEAEFNQKNYILQTCTNIDVENFDGNFYVDDLFWEAITKEISNYESFRDMLLSIVYEIKEQQSQKNSIGIILNSLLEKIYGIVEKFSNLTPEEISKMTEESSKLLEELKQNSLLSENNGKEK